MFKLWRPDFVPSLNGPGMAIVRATYKANFETENSFLGTRLATCTSFTIDRVTSFWNGLWMFALAQLFRVSSHLSCGPECIKNHIHNISLGQEYRDVTRPFLSLVKGLVPQTKVGSGCQQTLCFMLCCYSSQISAYAVSRVCALRTLVCL